MGHAILIVEDDRSASEYLRILLEEQGHDVRATANGIEALVALEASAYDLVISDINMPKMDGLELLTHLGQRWPELPVIMLTANDDVSDVVEAVSRGAVNYLVKPTSASSVSSAVEKAVGVRPPLDTDGCIALPNDRLLELEQAFAPNVTPVLIGEEMTWADTEAIAHVREALQSAVTEWAISLEKGDMYAWLELYDETFQHWGMNKAEWSAFSLETVGQRALIDVTVRDLLLLRDPSEEGLYLSRFRLDVTEEEAAKVTSMRRMYWRRSESGAFRIVAEDSG